jgi:hypothetical protein
MHPVSVPTVGQACAKRRLDAGVIRCTGVDALLVDGSAWAGSRGQDATLDDLMVESRGGHGEHSRGQYDVFRSVHRWI